MAVKSAGGALFLLLAFVGLGATPVWAAEAPAVEMQRVQGITLDGKLGDWSGVPLIRVGNAKHSSTPLQWHGAGDCSMNLYYGWNDTGLYVAGRVFDKDVRRGEKAADGDHLQLFFSCDPRANGPFSAGTFKIHVLPPTEGKPIAAEYPGVAKGARGMEGIQLAGQRLADGYTFEMHLPFAALPGFVSTDQSTVGAQVIVVDADKGRVYPQKVSRGVDAAHQGQLIRFRFRDSDWSKPTLEAFELYSNILIPDLVMERRPQWAIEAAASLIVPGCKVSVQVLEGDRVAAGVLLLPKSFMKAGDGLLAASFEPDLSQLADGDYTVAITYSAPGLARPMRVTQGMAFPISSKELVPQTISALDEAHLSQLVQREPFRASSHFGVVSPVEWLKWGLEQKATHAIREGTREIHNRLAALQGKALPDPDSMYGLLELTRNPEAQLVVEYFRERTPLYPQKASLSIYWGSAPLVSGLVDAYKTEAEAIKSLDQVKGVPYVRHRTIDGTAIYDEPQALREDFDLKTFDPGKQMLLLSGGKEKQVEVIPFETVGGYKPEGICLFAGTDAEAAGKIKAAAKAMNVPLLDEAGAKKARRLIYAGTPDDSPAGRAVKGAKAFITRVSPVTGSYYFTRGTMAFRIPYVSHEAADQFARIILAGKAATVAQADTIRQSIIKATGRTPRKLVMPAGMQVFNGNLHSHTFLSDGRVTPLALAAEAVYCGLDLHVQSDHGVFQGTLDFADSLKAHHLNYPLVVGTELNTRWGHVNIYPMRRDSTYVMGPTIHAVIERAHAQNQAIQWNHPDTGYSHLPDLLENGIQGSGFDAWEHYPPHYSQWKKEGKLPVITGGSDSHNGTFHLCEESFLVMPDAKGQTVADTVKAGNVILLDPWNGSYTITRDMVNKSHWDDLYFYGPDDKIQFAVDVLADPSYLKQTKIERLKQYMDGLDIAGLINASSAHETVK